jgi:hypothetical protein
MRCDDDDSIDGDIDGNDDDMVGDIDGGDDDGSSNDDDDDDDDEDSDDGTYSNSLRNRPCFTSRNACIGMAWHAHGIVPQR